MGTTKQVLKFKVLDYFYDSQSKVYVLKVLVDGKVVEYRDIDLSNILFIATKDLKVNYYLLEDKCIEVLRNKHPEPKWEHKGNNSVFKHRYDVR